MPTSPYSEGISSRFKRIMGSLESSDEDCDKEEGEEFKYITRVLDTDTGPNIIDSRYMHHSWKDRIQTVDGPRLTEAG